MFSLCPRLLFFLFFFFNDTATTEIYTLSLHDALPIYARDGRALVVRVVVEWKRGRVSAVSRIRVFDERRERAREEKLAPLVKDSYAGHGDRKSTRLNSSHDQISYAVFCLKKKKRTEVILVKRAAILSGLGQWRNNHASRRVGERVDCLEIHVTEKVVNPPKLGRNSAAQTE